MKIEFKVDLTDTQTWTMEALAARAASYSDTVKWHVSADRVRALTKDELRTMLNASAKVQAAVREIARRSK